MTGKFSLCDHLIWHNDETSSCVDKKKKPPRLAAVLESFLSYTIMQLTDIAAKFPLSPFLSISVD